MAHRHACRQVDPQKMVALVAHFYYDSEKYEALESFIMLYCKQNCFRKVMQSTERCVWNFQLTLKCIPRVNGCSTCKLVLYLLEINTVKIALHALVKYMLHKLKDYVN